MNTKKLTGIILIVVMSGLVVYDIIMAVNGVPGDTISERTWEIIPAQPWLAFLIGFVCGHLFWQRRY